MVLTKENKDDVARLVAVCVIFFGALQACVVFLRIQSLFESSNPRTNSRSNVFFRSTIRIFVRRYFSIFFPVCSGVASGAPNFCPSVKIIARNTLTEYYTTGPAPGAAASSGCGAVTIPFSPSR